MICKPYIWNYPIVLATAARDGTNFGNSNRNLKIGKKVYISKLSTNLKTVQCNMIACKIAIALQVTGSHLSNLSVQSCSSEYKIPCASVIKHIIILKYKEDKQNWVFGLMKWFLAGIWIGLGLRKMRAKSWLLHNMGFCTIATDCQIDER